MCRGGSLHRGDRAHRAPGLPPVGVDLSGQGGHGSLDAVGESVGVLTLVRVERRTEEHGDRGTADATAPTRLGTRTSRRPSFGLGALGLYVPGAVQVDGHHWAARASGQVRGPGGERRRQRVTLKNMEHVKRAIENIVAQESLKLESGLIWLAIAVSGAPFLGLLGTVWGVMSAFGGIAQAPQGAATLQAMAPGVAAALITTVAGLLVAIPSMFGYNWLVHNLRVFTVGLDNFAQELVSKMESEFLEEE